MLYLFLYPFVCFPLAPSRKCYVLGKYSCGNSSIISSRFSSFSCCCCCRWRSSLVFGTFLETPSRLPFCSWNEPGRAFGRVDISLFIHLLTLFFIRLLSKSFLRMAIDLNRERIEYMFSLYGECFVINSHVASSIKF